MRFSWRRRLQALFRLRVKQRWSALCPSGRVIGCRASGAALVAGCIGVCDNGWVVMQYLQEMEGAVRGTGQADSLSLACSGRWRVETAWVVEQARDSEEAAMGNGVCAHGVRCRRAGRVPTEAERAQLPCCVLVGGGATLAWGRTAVAVFRTAVVGRVSLAISSAGSRGGGERACSPRVARSRRPQRGRSARRDPRRRRE